MNIKLSDSWQLLSAILGRAAYIVSRFAERSLFLLRNGCVVLLEIYHVECVSSYDCEKAWSSINHSEISGFHKCIFRF
jgi:hypothetical protein